MPGTLSRLKGIFLIEKENAILGAWYIALLTVPLLACLFTVVLRPEGYNAGMYRNAYVYFLIYDFILFSLLVPFWDSGREKIYSIKQALHILAGISIMALSSLPLVLAFFMSSRLQLVNVMLPLLIKPLWGWALSGLKNLLEALRPAWKWTALALALCIFATLVLGSLLLYFTVEYRQAVITTLYDRDIPAAYFFNPLLALAGLVYAQAGGGSQMGSIPYYACAGFWALLAAVLHGGAVRAGAEARCTHEA